MNRLLASLAILSLTTTACVALEKVEPIQEHVGHVGKASQLPSGGAARSMDEWVQLKPMLDDLGEFPVNFATQTAVYCSLPSAFDGGSYPVQTVIGHHEGVLQVTCKAEWPDMFLEKTNTRRYHLVLVPAFHGPIEINFAVIGAQFAAFAKLFTPINVPPLEEYPIFGPAGGASQP